MHQSHFDAEEDCDFESYRYEKEKRIKIWSENES